MTPSKKLTMLVLCPFPVGVAAGQRLKYEQYFDDWRSLGYTIDVSPFMDMPMWEVIYQPRYFSQKIFGVLRGHIRRLADLLRIPGYDLVYIHMWVTPLGTDLMERAVRCLAKRIIYDIEDNILSGHFSSTHVNLPNSWVSRLKGPGKARFLIKHANHVITSSPFLNDRCLKINLYGACTYISSSVDTNRFVPATTYSNDRPVVIGWTGTFSSKMYLDHLSNVFVRLAKRVSFKLRVIGNFDYQLPGINFEVIRWASWSEVRDLQAFDIGVYPLVVDEWVFGKSGLKAIQYMAFGLPTVATNVGTTPLLIDHGVDGFLVESEDEWVNTLERLILEPELRRKLGEAARKKAVLKYSITAVLGEYRKVLSLVMKS